MASYLVTGGAGFIGSHLVDRLLADGHRVRVVDDLSSGLERNVDARADLVVADLREPGVVEAGVAGVEGIFHLAAVASVARCNEAWTATHGINATATIALLDAARRAPDGPLPVVYASSAAVYGDCPELPIDEDAPLRPLSPYGADKAAGELHARAGAEVHGIASVGLRFFNVYGPRQRPDDAYAGVITLFADRIERGEPLTIFGDGEQSRDFVHVDDVVTALDRAMWRLHVATVPSALICNVGTGRAITINALAETLMGVLDRRVPIRRAPERAGDIRHSVAATLRAREVLELAETTVLRDGLARMLARTPAL
jgi:UDP-glucose 4-epimerase